MKNHTVLGVCFLDDEVIAGVYSEADGKLLAKARHPFSTPSEENQYRRHPRVYLEATEAVLCEALEYSFRDRGLSAEQVSAVGISASSKTVLPVDEWLLPLALKPELSSNNAAFVSLPQESSSRVEENELNMVAREQRPEYLAPSGGGPLPVAYWARVLNALRADPSLFAAARSWVELGDFIPAMLAGITNAEALPRSLSLASQSSLYNEHWGGYPEAGFLSLLDPQLAELRNALPEKPLPPGSRAGGLCEPWAERTGLPAGIPVTVGLDAGHAAALGVGIEPGRMVSIFDGGLRDLLLIPGSLEISSLPGVYHIASEALLPEYQHLEASAPGFDNRPSWIEHPTRAADGERTLPEGDGSILPGSSGLLAIPYATPHTTPPPEAIFGLRKETSQGELYRALLEGSAYAGREILERLEESGERVAETAIVRAHSVDERLLPRILADVLNRPIRTAQEEFGSCASRGAAATALFASGNAGSLQEAGLLLRSPEGEFSLPEPERVQLYDRIYEAYSAAKAALGEGGGEYTLGESLLMLEEIRNEVRGV